MGKLGGLEFLNLEGSKLATTTPMRFWPRWSPQTRESDHLDPETLSRADPGRAYRATRAGDQERRCRLLRELHSAEGGALWRDRSGSWRRCLVVQSTVSTVRHISTEYKSLDIAKILRFPEGAGHCRQHRLFQCHAGTHANRGGRCFDRSGAWGGLHVAPSSASACPKSPQRRTAPRHAITTSKKRAVTFRSSPTEA